MTWFGKFWRTNASFGQSPAVPPGIRLYAIGDVHGHDELLEELLGLIDADRASRSPARVLLIFLGDLIDRGPHSSKVIARLLALSREWQDLIILKGNHEEVLLRILDGEDKLVQDWLRFGGDMCLESYGVRSDGLRQMSAAQAGALVRQNIPRAHVSFMRGFHDTFTVGDYLFVHAGIRPGIPIHNQSLADLRWIRSPFLEWSGRHDFMIVHGHTITENVEETPSRIGIDTGAYFHGTLTAMAAEGADRWFIQASRRRAS